MRVNVFLILTNLQQIKSSDLLLCDDFTLFDEKKPLPGKSGGFKFNARLKKSF